MFLRFTGVLFPYLLVNPSCHMFDHDTKKTAHYDHVERFFCYLTLIINTCLSMGFFISFPFDQTIILDAAVFTQLF